VIFSDTKNPSNLLNNDSNPKKAVTLLKRGYPKGSFQTKSNIYKPIIQAKI
jgi:hypothetical protein